MEKEELAILWEKVLNDSAELSKKYQELKKSGKYFKLEFKKLAYILSTKNGKHIEELKYVRKP